MDEKRRAKRAKVIDDGRWDCSVCTFSNTQEAFKCEMCDVRKGTSTRKPRINPDLVAQQVSPQFNANAAAGLPPNILPIKKEKTSNRRSKSDTDPPSPYSDQGSPLLNEHSNSGSNSIPETGSNSLKSELKSDPSSTPPAHFSSNSAFVTGKYSSEDNDKIVKSETETNTETNDVFSNNNISPDNNSLHNSRSTCASKNESSLSVVNTPATGTSEIKLQPRRKRISRLKNIDRSSATTMEVTVGDVTVLITDYKLKKEKPPSDSHINGNVTTNNSLNGLNHQNRLDHDSNISNSEPYNDMKS